MNLRETTEEEQSQVTGEAHCSVTVWRKRRPYTIASNGPEAAALDEARYASNQGPCIEETAGAAALNCYSPDPGQVRDALLDLTTVAARAVTLSVKLQSEADLAADLAAAMESHPTARHRAQQR